MKKAIIAVASVAVILFACVFCYNSLFHHGTTSNCRTSIINKTTDYFSEREIKSAMSAVKKQFTNFEGCDLVELYYDAEKYPDSVLESEAKDYGCAKVIILLSSFDTNSNCEGCFGENETYSNWKWILTKENEHSKWKVKDWGYG